MTADLQKRPIGRTGLDVSVLGFGTMAVGGQYTDVDQASAEATIATALDNGITYFDTAPQYGCGLAEERLGAALAALGSGAGAAVVSTKVGKAIVPIGSGGQVQRTLIFPGGHDCEMGFDFTYDGTMRIVEDSLRRLRTDRIGMLLIHDVTRHFHGDAIDQVYRTASDGALKAIRRLRESGTTRAIGIGLKDCDIAQRFVAEGGIDAALIPGRLTLNDQTVVTSGLLAAARRNGVSIIAAAPFDTGILVTGPIAGARSAYAVADEATRARVAAMQAVCVAFDVPLPAGALQYALRFAGVAAVLAGMKTPAEVRQNTAWMRHPIPTAFWEELAARCRITVAA